MEVGIERGEWIELKVEVGLEKEEGVEVGHIQLVGLKWRCRREWWGQMWDGGGGRQGVGRIVLGVEVGLEAETWCNSVQ